MENIAPRTAETLVFEALKHDGGPDADILHHSIDNGDNETFILRLRFVKYETDRARTSRKATSGREDAGGRHGHREDTEQSGRHGAGARK